MIGPSHGLWQKRHIALFALLATATSGFGQTFFVAVFGAELRTAFDLSHAAYGLIYSLATLLSAGMLLRAGPWADHWPLSRITGVAVALLAGGCLLIGLAPHALVLGVGFFLIRFAGQGLMAHIGLVTAGRYFRIHRGKAVAIAAAGIPLAEAVLPATGVAILALGGWRTPWLAGFALLIAVVLPGLMLMARRIEGHAGRRDSDTPATADTVPDFTRGQALRDPGLYLLLPAALATPFVVTAVLFHQAAIAEARGWSLELIATAFVGFAAGHFLTLIAAGPMVDRIGAQRTLPLGLLPMVAGLTVLALGSGTPAAFTYLALTGMTVGATATTNGAIWAERYGTTHLGAIRSVAQAAMVLSTACAPIALGSMLDLGLTVRAIGLGLALATGAAALLVLLAPAAPRSLAAGASANR